jgi:hypothetical protein
LPSISDTIDQLDNITITNTGSDKELATPLYSDQILPFDITLTGANEIWRDVRGSHLRRRAAQRRNRHLDRRRCDRGICHLRGSCS